MATCTMRHVAVVCNAAVLRPDVKLKLYHTKIASKSVRPIDFVVHSHYVSIISTGANTTSITNERLKMLETPFIITNLSYLIDCVLYVIWDRICIISRQLSLKAICFCFDFRTTSQGFI